MQLTLDELQRKLGGEVEGSGEVTIEGVADLEGTRPGLISFAESE